MITYKNRNNSKSHEIVVKIMQLIHLKHLVELLIKWKIYNECFSWFDKSISHHTNLLQNKGLTLIHTVDEANFFIVDFKII